MKKNKFLIIIFSLIIASIIGIISYNINLKEVEVSTVVKASNTVIPRPLKYEENKGEFLLNNDTKIYINGNNEEETEEINKIAKYLKEKIE